MAQTLTNKAAMILEWLPLYSLGMAVVDAAPGKAKALAVTKVLKFIAEKTPFVCDDELVDMVESIVQTEQGAALVDYLSQKVRGAMEEINAGN